MKENLTLLMVGLVALSGMSGCLEVDQELILKKDGSGTITDEMMMGAQLVAMWQGGLGGAGAEKPLADLYDAEKYKKQAANYGEGVKYSKMEKIERNGGKGVRVTYTFADINTVKYSPGSALDDLNSEERGAEKDEPITFAYAAGVLTVNLPERAKGGEGGAEVANPADAAAEAMMMQMFRDMKLSAKMTVDPGIVNSDATYLDGNVIIFTQLDFNEILKNPDGIRVLKKLDRATRAEMKDALEGVKGVKIETKKKVLVTVK